MAAYGSVPCNPFSLQNNLEHIIWERFEPGGWTNRSN